MAQILIIIDEPEMTEKTLMEITSIVEELFKSAGNTLSWKIFSDRDNDVWSECYFE